MNTKSLYVHIPFCEHICGYCDFTKLLYNEEFASKYVEALILEIKSYNIPKMETIYLGGGTPSALELGKFSQIVDFLGSYLKKNGEFTIEANVENLTKEKLEVLRKAGVNRLSIGVQTTHDEILKTINRHHTFEDAKKVVALAKEYGFTNQFLHASEVHFGELAKPLSNLSKKCFKAPMPEEYNNLLDKLRDRKKG